MYIHTCWKLGRGSAVSTVVMYTALRACFGAKRTNIVPSRRWKNNSRLARTFKGFARLIFIHNSSIGPWDALSARLKTTMTTKTKNGVT